jgi:hypothetical protein
MERTYTLIPEGPSPTGLAEAGLDTAARRLLAAEAAYGEDHPEVKRNASFFLDLVCLLATAKVVLLGRGAR